jgi:DNA invertase Pin-like site-specific DNA recombinase
MQTALDLQPRRFVAYYRVSTARQGASGLGLDAQRAAVAKHIGSGELVSEFTEVESGKRSDRPELARALAAAKRAKATLVIAKLDRLARNVRFIATLMDTKGVEFEACDFPQASRLLLHMMAAVAEHEASAISSRTKAALAAAKARGVELGKTALAHQAAAAAANVAVAQARRDAVAPVVAAIRASGVVTLQGIADALNARGITTPRGGMWSPTQVRRLEA